MACSKCQQINCVGRCGSSTITRENTFENKSEGINGLSAYELYVQGGGTMTLDEWREFNINQSYEEFTW